MGNIFFERYSALCRAAGETPNSVAKEIGASSGSVTAWKKGTEPRNATMTKIADYFDTTVDYLTGRIDDPENSDRFGLEDPTEMQKEKAPTAAGERSVSDDELKFALWGNCEDISDDDLADVRRYAAFVRERKKDKR